MVRWGHLQDFQGRRRCRRQLFDQFANLNFRLLAIATSCCFQQLNLWLPLHQLESQFEQASYLNNPRDLRKKWVLGSCFGPIDHASPRHFVTSEN